MEPQDLTFSQGLGPIRDDCERAKQILGRNSVDLTTSDLVFVDVYLRNFDHVKSRLEAMVESCIDEPPVVAELLALSDRMDLTLKRFLEMQEHREEHAQHQQEQQHQRQPAHGSRQEPQEVTAEALEDLATSAADYALMQEMQLHDHSGASTPSLQDEEVWPDFAAFDCPICFDRVESPEQGLRLRHCGHATCRACAADVVSTAVNSAKVLDLCCPAPGCDSEFTYGQIRSLLDVVISKERKTICIERVCVCLCVCLLVCLFVCLFVCVSV